MMTMCLDRSKTESSIAERAIKALAGWWSMYTLLHNRGLVEQMLREKQTRGM